MALGALAALFGGVASTAPKAYFEGRQRQFDYDEEKQGALGKAAFGNALTLMQQGGGGMTGGLGGPPPGMGGAGPPPGPPAQPPPPGQDPNIMKPMQGPMQPGPPPGAGPPPGMVNPTGNLTGPPNIPPGGFGTGGPHPMMPQGPGLQQPPRPPPGPGGPGGAPPGGMAGPPGPPGGGNMSQPMPGQFTIPQLAQAIQRANPGIDGRGMFEAMKQGMGILSPAAQLDFKGIMLQQREEEINIKLQRLQQMSEQFQQSDETKRRGQDFGLTKTQDRAVQAEKKTEQSEGDVKEIVQGIQSGHQPPVVTGLYGKGPAVRAGLERAGFDLGKAQLEWQGAQRQVASLNGPQMTRFNVLASTVDSTIDHVKELSEKMKLSGIPLLNQLELQAYIQAQGDTENSKLATAYMTAVNGLKEEFANLANGGYAPTAPAWKLANDQINGNYSVGKLGASLDEVQRLIRYRMQAIQSKSGTENRYAPGQGEKPAQVPTPKGGGGSSGGLPPGWSVEVH